MLSVTRRNQIAYFFFEAFICGNCVSDEVYGIVREFAVKSGIPEFELWQFDLNKTYLKNHKKKPQKQKEKRKTKK
jgi:hypothetical protein